MVTCHFALASRNLVGFGQGATVMKLDRMIGLTEGFATKADKMRVLDQHGIARADIARFLGVRYQQVRNTLEGDKRTGYSPELIPSHGPYENGPVVAFQSLRFVPLELDDDQNGKIPNELIEDFVDQGKQLYAVCIEGGVFLSDEAGMIGRIRHSFA
jgi:hypothetical protein